MRKRQRTDFFREIRKSITRYLSIMLIVSLGVAFFAGVRSSEPDMKISVDEYYDSVNFYDIRLASTIGFTEEDIEEIAKTEGVAQVQSLYSCEMYYKSEEVKYVLSLYSLPETINNLTVSEGRLPKEENECLVDAYFAGNAGLKLGDTITFTPESGKEISESLKGDTFTICGLGTSAEFLTFDRGTASIGTGKSNGYVYIPKTSFTLSVYTGAYVTLNGAKNLRCYGEEYEQKVNQAKTLLEVTGENRCNIRIDDYKKKTHAFLKEITDTYNKQKKEAEEQFKEALDKIQEGEVGVTNARIAIRKENEEIEKLELELPALESEVERTAKNLAEKPKEIEKIKKKIPALEKNFETAKEELETAKQAYELDPSAENQEILDDCQSAYSRADSELKIAKRKVEEGITLCKEENDKAVKSLEEKQKEIQAHKDALEKYTKFIEDTEEEVKKARATYNEQKLASDSALGDAYAKIELTSKQVTALDGAKWYLLDRNTVQNYVEFLSDAEKVGALGTVFPIIFFIVAALISLTTMTRMVEEQRVQIGTLKALGYSKASVASKYIFYALSASLIGSIIGSLVGSQLLPSVIIGAYKILYQDLLLTVTPINITNSLIATLAAVLCTTGATFLACYKELGEQAASLMRPVAPKYGKVILLEKVGFIWKKLSFSRKSTIRNIVRYKKRFFMTLFGIAGCMGLLMVGFGLRDSISSIVDNQYKNVWIYDATVTLSNKLSDVDRNILDLEILSNENVNDAMPAYVKSIDITNGKNDKSVYIFVPESTEKIDEFVILKNRKTDEHYVLDDSGVILTEKIAKQLGVSVGGTVKIKEENAVIGEVKVNAIVENYIYNYMYMTPQVYENIYSKSPEFNDVYLTLHDNSEDAINKLASDFTSNEKITMVSFVSELQEKVENMMRSLDYVVYVLIISAGLLAIIVLYNLVNINITERRRELATIKLLGFYDLELAQYVYRENVILTVLGTMVGVVFGIFLHKFVIETTEIDMIMFGRQIGLLSYFFSIVLTLFFAFIVNFWMYFKLKKIDMVESLKSVE